MARSIFNKGEFDAAMARARAKAEAAAPPVMAAVAELAMAAEPVMVDPTLAGPVSGDVEHLEPPCHGRVSGFQGLGFRV